MVCFVCKAEEEEGMRKQVVLAKPFSLDDEKDSEHTTSNLIQRILSLFKNVRPGSDLTNFQVCNSLFSDLYTFATFGSNNLYLPQISVTNKRKSILW